MIEDGLVSDEYVQRRKRYTITPLGLAELEAERTGEKIVREAFGAEVFGG